jgi:ketosteroid isomerase-like protein
MSACARPHAIGVNLMPGRGSVKLPAMSADENRQIVERVLHALVEDDAPAMRPFVHDDVIWWVPASASKRFGLARPLQGWDDISWLGGDGWKGFEPGSSVLTIHHLVAEGDLVSAHYQRVATRVGGAPYDAEYNMLFRLVDGRVVEVWEIADTATAFGT